MLRNRYKLLAEKCQRLVALRVGGRFLAVNDNQPILQSKCFYWKHENDRLFDPLTGNVLDIFSQTDPQLVMWDFVPGNANQVAVLSPLSIGGFTIAKDMFEQKM